MIRNAWVRKTSGVRTDHVTRAADGMQKRGLEPTVDLGAQSRDMNVDDVRLGIEVVLPDILQQHRAGHDLSRMAHQIFQEAEFAGLKLDRRARPLRGAG